MFIGDGWKVRGIEALARTPRLPEGDVGNGVAACASESVGVTR